MAVEIDWDTIAKWNVGDDINADTWTTKWYEPMGLFLRRPITAVHKSTSTTVPASTDYTQNATFDVIDQDDDEMCSAGTPVDKLYVQRSGVYDIYGSMPYTGTAPAGTLALAVEIRVTNPAGATTVLVERSSSGTAITAADQARGVDCSAKLSEGDAIFMALRNMTASSFTVPALYSSPRLVVMWRGPL